MLALTLYRRIGLKKFLILVSVLIQFCVSSEVYAGTLEDRIEAAREVMLKAAVNPLSLKAGSKEALCHIITADVDFITCGVFNSLQEPVGAAIVAFKNAEVEFASKVLTDCRVGKENNEYKPDCIYLLKLSNDGVLLQTNIGVWVFSVGG